MKHWLRILSWAAAVAAGLVFSVQAAETEHCTLELVRLEAKPAGQGVSQSEWLYRGVNSQGFFMRPGQEQNTGFEKAFKAAVKKEPEKYVAKTPLRGAVKFGDKRYGFVFDKQEEKSKGYDRLYFDVNGNGDLTDDKPLDALTDENSTRYPENYIRLSFPRVDLPIEVDGKKFDYSFLAEEQGWDKEYIYPQFKAGVYGRGEITLDGKTMPVAVLDYNSNGRFDDVVSMKNMSHGSNGELYPRYGDKLLVEPEHVTSEERQDSSLRSVRQPYLSKINALDGKYYELKVSPVGDELGYTPSTAPLGKIACPHTPCTVELISKRGYIPLVLKDSEPAEVPAGKWRLLSYTWSVKDWKKPPKEEKKEDAKKSGDKATLFTAFKKALEDALPRKSARYEPLYGPENESRISARGTNKSEAIRVTADQTTTLKVGPPYKLQVKVQYLNPGTAHLALYIVGADGETVSNLYVNGRRPPKPKITITDPQDEVVQQGAFEYG
ncbi:MAG: hypothetical protein JXB10_07330 [Pirellulales bacterium]|nr:hypothetical protein [Pirellulales bacterium]